MWPFGGTSSGSPRRIPTTRVMSLSSEGMSEPQIINTLKNEGYTPGEVDSAMRQALRDTTAPPRGIPPASEGARPVQQPTAQEQMPLRPPKPLNSSQPPGMPREPVGQQPPSPAMQPTTNPLGMGAPDDDSDIPSPEPPPGEIPGLAMPSLPGEDAFPVAPSNLPTPPKNPPSPSSHKAREDESESGMGEPIPRLREPMTRKESRDEKRMVLEEMVEGMVDERWSEFRQELASIREDFDGMFRRLDALESSFKSLKDDTLSDRASEKSEKYDQSMEEMSSRMEAMENALKNSMTPMMQAMRSLSNTVKDLKAGNETPSSYDDTDSDSGDDDLVKE